MKKPNLNPIIEKAEKRALSRFKKNYTRVIKEKTIDDLMDNCIANLDKGQKAIRGFYNGIQEILKAKKEYNN